MPLQRPEDLPRPGCPLHPRRRPGAPRRQAAAQHAELELQQSSWSCSSGSTWSSWAATGGWWKLEPTSSQARVSYCSAAVPAAVLAAHIRRAPPNIAAAPQQTSTAGSIVAECSPLFLGARLACARFPCCSNSCSSSRSAARCSSSASAPPSWPGPCCTASSTARFVPPVLHCTGRCRAAHGNADSADARWPAARPVGQQALSSSVWSWQPVSQVSQ